MKYALVNNVLVEAKPGIKGLCAGCSNPVVAKCGTQRIHHWAHSKIKMCDRWWESETIWHRSWKNNFPVEWQEIFMLDSKTGEKHVADIRTADGWVIEFQHSPIHREERAVREGFYRNMVWVVDGSRLKRDSSRFFKGKESFYMIDKGIFRFDFFDDNIPAAWHDNQVPVIFDFQGDDIINPQDARAMLYCLLPVRFGRYGIIAEISRTAFITTVISGELFKRLAIYVRKLMQQDHVRQEHIRKQQILQFNMMVNRAKPKRHWRL